MGGEGGEGVGCAWCGMRGCTLLAKDKARTVQLTARCIHADGELDHVRTGRTPTKLGFDVLVHRR